MGGDDLDDDYLLESSGVIDDEDVSTKRSHLSAATVVHHDSDEQDGDIDEAPHKRRKITSENVLVEAGCGIESKSLEEQLSFLKTSLNHYAMLASSSQSEKNVDEKDDRFDQSLGTKSLVSSSKDTLIERIRDVVSLKRVKNHRSVPSPAVVVICQSARRAVAVLKELTDLRLRAVKLFPKSGDVTQQLSQLRATPFPLAVGTPHRLAALCHHEKGLTFQNTQLVVLDTFISKKQFTVCTLPDTAADTMGLLSEHVLPQLKTNKSLRLAFL